jgi:glutathione S-transferase
MILVGQYDSPYARRVAVSLHVLGFDFTQDTRSVFGDFDSMRGTNPLGRVPSLILDDGEVLIDSAAILDHLDALVGPSRALLPASGTARREALRRIALATGVNDKVMGIAYERLIRPAPLRWEEWIARCRVQAEGALAALDALPWPDGGTLDQAQITTVCTLGYVRLAQPELVQEGRYAVLDRLAARCEAMPAFAAMRPASYAVPRSG